MSVLDEWFGPKAQPDDEPPADPGPGVIEGVKRKPQKRYAQRWYQRMRRCKTVREQQQNNT